MITKPYTQSINLFIEARSRYQQITALLTQRGWPLRILITLGVVFFMTLLWYLLLGYVQFHVWEQPDSSRVKHHFLLDWLGYNDGIECKYYDLAAILLMWANSLGIALPALLGVWFITAWLVHYSGHARSPIIVNIAGLLLNIFIVLLPGLIGFYVTEAYYLNDPNHAESWFSERYYIVNADRRSIEWFSVYALAALTPWLLWCVLLCWGGVVRIYRFASHAVTMFSAVLSSQVSISGVVEENIQQSIALESKVDSNIRHEWTEKLNLYRAAVARFFGYDFFISYSRQAEADVAGGGYDYAHRLKTLLEQDGFRCFIDDSEMHPGEAWRRSVYKALMRSSVLLVVANKIALRQNSVIGEVRAFAPLQKPIMPIVFEGSVNKLDKASEPGKQLEQRLWCDEPEGLNALRQGEPSREVIDTCDQAFSGVRIQRIRQFFMGTVIMVLSGLTAVTWVSANNEKQARKALQVQLVASASINEQTQSPSLALVLARKSGDLLKNEKPPSASVRAASEALSKWPDLLCIQRLVPNTLLANTPWLERDFVAVGSSYAMTFPGRCEPRQYQSIKHRDRKSYGPINPISGTYCSAAGDFLLGDYQGNLYRLSRDLSDLKKLAHLSKNEIRPLVSTSELPHYIFYATKHSNTNKPELCLFDTDSQQKNCSQPQGLEYSASQLVLTADAVFVLSNGKLLHTHLVRDAGMVRFNETAWKTIPLDIVSVNRFSWNQASGLILVSSDNQYTLFNSATQAVIQQQEYENSYISGLAFADDGSEFAISLEDRTASQQHRVMRIAVSDGQVLAEYPSMDRHEAAHISYTANGKQLIIVSEDGMTAMWDLHTTPDLPVSLPAPILSSVSRYGGGFDVLLGTQERPAPTTDAAMVRLHALPTDSNGEVHDFVTSPDEDIVMLSRGERVFVKHAGDDWQHAITAEEDTEITHISIYDHEAWLFRNDLKFARFDLQGNHFLSAWQNTPRSEARWLGSGTHSSDIDNNSRISAVLKASTRDHRLLILRDGSLVSFSNSWLQDLKLLPAQHTLTHGIAGLDNNNIRVSVAGALVAVTDDGWMQNDSLEVFDFAEHRKVRDKNRFNGNPMGVALSSQGEMLALLLKSDDVAEGNERVILQLLDAQTFDRMMPDIPVPGADLEACNPQLAFDAVNENMLLSRCGLDYLIMPMSYQNLYQRLVDKVPLDLYPSEASRYGLEYIELPQKPH